MTTHKKLALALAALSGLSAQAAILSVDADITVDTTWTTGNTYVLESIYAVRSGATLTVQPGVIIRGQPRETPAAFNPGTLVVAAGSRIIANGTAAQPIIFTTAAVDLNGNGEPDLNSAATTSENLGFYYRATGAVGGVYPDTTPFWDNAPTTAPKRATYVGLCGGLLVLGRAPVNVDTNSATPTIIESGNVEGIPSSIPASYGGDRPYDSSGSLRYWSIRHGGAEIGANNEINGLTLAGVGSGTFIENIEVFGNADDGIEWFGGTVNSKNLLVSCVEDDGFDADLGFTGKTQFGLIIAGPLSDNAFELDGDLEFDPSPANSGDVTANRRPVANYVFANITAIGNRGRPANFDRLPERAGTRATGTFRGFMIRDNASPIILNSIMVATQGSGLRVRSLEPGSSTTILPEGQLPALPSPSATPTFFGYFDSRQRFIDSDAYIAGTTFFNINGVSVSYTGTAASNLTTAQLNALFPPGSDSADADLVLDDQIIYDIFRPTLADKLANDDIAAGVVNQVGAQAVLSVNNRIQNPGFFPFAYGSVDGSATAGYPTFINPTPGRTGQGGIGSAFTGVSALDVIDGFFFTPVTYRGAFSTAPTGNLWTAGWTASDKTFLATRAQDTSK